MSNKKQDGVLAGEIRAAQRLIRENYEELRQRGFSCSVERTDVSWGTPSREFHYDPRHTYQWVFYKPPVSEIVTPEIRL